MRARRTGLGVLSLVALLGLGSSGCSDTENNDKVLDAVIVASDGLFKEIESNPDEWLTPIERGEEVAGSMTAASGGRIEAIGWRFGAVQEASSGLYHGYTEKLFLSLDNYSANGVFMTGSVVVTRHSLDFGDAQTEIVEDASRTNVFQGVLSTNGNATGSYTIDVHALASGTILWTCGTINDEPTGHGTCY